jgi:hypothetical protein
MYIPLWVLALVAGYALGTAVTLALLWRANRKLGESRE